MVRTQIQLAEEQAVTLRRLAGERRESVAELIRRGIEILVHSISDVGFDERRRRAIAVAGRFRSGRRNKYACCKQKRA